MPAVTTVTAHSLDYCFAVAAPSSPAVRFMTFLQELRAAELAALFLCRECACPHSLGAIGGLLFSPGIVSREWAAIQSTASFSKANFPKWCTAPFGHIIRTRQISPSHTGNKTAPINSSMLHWMRLTSLLVRRTANVQVDLHLDCPQRR